MKCSHLSLLAIASALFISAPASAEVDTRWRFVGQWDNDIFAGTDRGYTNGSRFAFVRELDPDRDTHSKLQRALYDLSGSGSESFWGDDRRFRSEDAIRFSYGIGINQLMYTPDAVNPPAAPEGERPYAGWLGLEVSLNVSDRKSVGSITFSIGTTGKNSFAEETQEWVHQNISNSPVYQGWDSQVPGELTLNLHYNRKEVTDLFSFSNQWPVQLDGYYEWGAALGNFRTNAYLGSLLRFGHNLTNAYATPRVQIGSYGNELFAPHKDTKAFSIYGFAGVRATAVLHDISLDGPIFRDFDTGVDSKPLVGEYIYGIAIHFGSADISLSQTTRSDEFTGQNEISRFGSMMLRLDLPF